MINGIYTFQAGGQGALNIKRPIDKWQLSDSEKNDMLKIFEVKDFKQLFLDYSFKWVQEGRYMICSVYIDFKNLEIKNVE